ncbi:cytochrome P450 family protein [Micromonospora sp. DT229]|uniref:cytochrome P450 family protein n=1 Tax=Micromonospora sp. DT229 TaxID=3393430 RepID=UPI003CEC502F
MITFTDGELGRALLTERSMQWLYAHGGDPLARLLRAEDDDRRELIERIRERGPIHLSRVGAWVTGDHQVATEILADPRITARSSRTFPAGHVLYQCDAFPELSPDARRRLAEIDLPQEIVERVCAATATRIGSEFDLVTDLLRPILAGLLAEMLALPPEHREALGRDSAAAAIALDAVLCPPTLPAARSMMTAVDDLTARLRTCPGGESTVAAGTVAGVLWVEVTANLLANALLALLDQPGRWDSLAGEQDRADEVVSDTLRHDPPIRMHALLAHEDVEIAGRRVAAGSDIVVYVEAAQHGGAAVGVDLPLAGGSYLDLLAPAVRATAAAVLRVLAVRLPGLRRTGPVVRRLRAPVTHAIVRFPVSA